MCAESMPLKCLWISRDIPYPLDTGARVYSARVAESLAECGASIRYLGYGSLHAIPAGTHIDWVPVPGARRGQRSALFSALPLAAAVDATPAYDRLLSQQLEEYWDVIAIDGYGAGWALARHAARLRRQCGLLLHVSQNHETAVWRSMASGAEASLTRRLALLQNWLKVRALERRILRHVDLLTTITEEDATTLGAGMVPERRLTLLPGHSGWRAAARSIDALTPRRAIIVGSFHWAIKQENLRRFLEVADPLLAQHGIGLDVVGAMPETLLGDLQRRCRATRFLGFVDDLAPYLAQARIAIVPELIGGGFKIKLLDYIFARVPVALLSQAAAGMPEALRTAMLLGPNPATLTHSIVDHVDRFEQLNRMQQQAYALAESLYNWPDRGVQLERAIRRLRPAPARAAA